jgi:lipid-binding SYLF domain-containing protein
MRKPLSCLVLALAATVLSAAPAAAQGRTLPDAVEVLTAMADVPEAELMADLLGEVQAVAIIPNARRLGFIVGVQSGTGVMAVRGADGSWGSPLFVHLSGASVGWQVGIQSADLVLFFRTRKSVEAILDGAFTMGVDVSIAAGSLGRQAGAGTDADMRAEIYSYSRARGLFAGVSLGGSTLSVDSGATTTYYGREVRPADIIGGARLREPTSAGELRRALAGLRKLRQT